MRALSEPALVSSSRAPRCRFILSAVCQVRQTTSPTRPMACESEDMIEIAPMSCRMSSAAMVSPRIRDSAKATSSGIEASRWWQTCVPESGTSGRQAYSHGRKRVRNIFAAPELMRMLMLRQVWG
jgi:hypothetical protein